MTTSVELDIPRTRAALQRLLAAVSGLRMSWTVQVVCVLGLATVVSRSPGIVFNGMFDRDESYLAVTGDVLRDGGRLYIDVIDRKPPIVPALYAVIREWSVDMRAIRLVLAVLIFLNGVVVAELVRRLARSRRASLFAGVLAVVGTALFLPPDAQAANFELWGLLPASSAILCIVVARSSRLGPTLWFTVAGAAVMIAANCKQPYIAVAIPVLFEAWRRSGDRWRSASGALVGAVIVFVPFLVVVDAPEMVRWVWSDNGDYLDGGVSIGRAVGIGIALGLAFVVMHLPLLYGLWATVRRSVRADATILVWIAVSALVIPIGLRFFGHYFQQLVPPLAVLTGCALAVAGARVWRTMTILTTGLVVVMLAVAFTHRPDLTNFTALGRYVQSTTTPDQRILVWGALPDVYVAAERRPAGVFLHDGYLTGNWASRDRPLSDAAIAAEPFRSRWTMFLDDVVEHPPAIVIDAARPGTDWEQYRPQSFPVGAWLDRCYQIDRVVDGLVVWRRDIAACPM